MRVNPPVRAALVALLLCCPWLHSQGCSQCRDSLGQAPERTRAAYRHGIEVLVLASLTLSAASAWVLKSRRP